MSFQKAQSFYERKKDRQRKLQQFEDVSSVGSGSERSSARLSARRMHWENEGMLESARKFLRDEDDELPQDILSDHPKNEAKSQRSPLFPHNSSNDNWDEGSIIIHPEDKESANIYNQTYQPQQTHNPNPILSFIGDTCMQCFQGIWRPLVGCSEYLVAGGVTFMSYPRKRQLVILGGLFTVIAIIVAIAVAATSSGGGGGNDVSGHSTTGGGQVGEPGDGDGPFHPNHPVVPTNPKRFEDIRQLIIDSGITHEAHLDEQGSYQNKALYWISDHDAAKIQTNDTGVLQRYALAGLFFSTYVQSFEDSHNHAASIVQENAIQWHDSANWMTKKDICEWYGVKCVDNILEFEEPSDGNINVVTLDLSDNNIIGPIPSELVALKRLITLDLSGNKMVGTIPTALGGLTHTVNFFLQSNELTGTIPSEIGTFRHLRDLDLSDNELMGSIPAAFEKLVQLRSLRLGQNMIDGRMLNVVNITDLEFLYLDDNEFSGTIPSSYTMLSNLKEFEIRNNEIHGDLPPGFGGLAHLEVLSMGFNMFEGTLPFEIFSMAALTDLRIQHNKINGIIPDEIGLLARLENVYLEENELSGSIPDEVGTLQDLRVFRFYGNNFTGTVPEALCDEKVAPRPQLLAGECAICSCCDQCGN